MKLLFPVDGSDFALATSMVSVFREVAELVLINVQLPVPHPRALAWVGKEVVAEYYGIQSDEELAGARQWLERSGIASR